MKKILIITLLSIISYSFAVEYGTYTDTGNTADGKEVASSSQQASAKQSTVSEVSQPSPAPEPVQESKPVVTSSQATSSKPMGSDIISRPIGTRYLFGSLALTGNFGNVYASKSTIDKSYMNLGFSVNLGIRADNYAILVEYSDISFKEKYGYYKFNIVSPSLQFHKYFSENAYFIVGVGNTIAKFNEYATSGFSILGGLGISMPITNNVIVNISDVISYSRLVGDGSPQNNVNNSVKIGVSYAIAAQVK